MIEEKLNIENKIKKMSKYIKIIGHADDKTVCAIENALHVKLPDSYIWFLQQYSILLLPGFMILGAGLTDDSICVNRTIKYREFGLPNSLVVIEDEGNECVFCLDTSRMTDGECPVVMWTKEGLMVVKDYYQTFYQYLDQRLIESKMILENK
jgi:hypothetical protein